MSDQYFFPRDELYQRSPFIPLLDYYPSYFIWMKNYTRLFSIFDSTILQCKQKVDVGIYDPGKYICVCGVSALYVVDFLTAILHRGLRDFFLSLSNLLFPISIWTFIFLFLFGIFFPFSLWTFISLFS